MVKHRPGLLLTDIPFQSGYSKNDDGHPLFISVTDVVAQNVAASQTSRSSSESSLYTPHPKRKERWEQLNLIFENSTKKSKTLDSTAYWSQVKGVLRTTSYIQSSKAIPEAPFDILCQYLSFVTKCFGPVTSGKESQRLHLIAPIIICVCFLFNGDVLIEVEEDLAGEFLKVHGHFEFVLRRGDKRICIVEAKKDDICQGMAQDLLGCEVAAEVDRLNLVYGIVTNFVQWNFLRSLDEKIEMDECSLELVNGAATHESLALIAGKIYAMLSDE